MCGVDLSDSWGTIWLLVGHRAHASEGFSRGMPCGHGTRFAGRPMRLVPFLSSGLLFTSGLYQLHWGKSPLFVHRGRCGCPGSCPPTPDAWISSHGTKSVRLVYKPSSSLTLPSQNFKTSTFLHFSFWEGFFEPALPSPYSLLCLQKNQSFLHPSLLQPFLLKEGAQLWHSI